MILELHIFLASNSLFHARIKHVRVDVHFIHEKVQNRRCEGPSSSQFYPLRDKLVVSERLVFSNQQPFDSHFIFVFSKKIRGELIANKVVCKDKLSLFNFPEKSRRDVIFGGVLTPITMQCTVHIRSDKLTSFTFLINIFLSIF